MREYFFDRSPRNFDAVLGLYRNGKLHLAAGVSDGNIISRWPNKSHISGVCPGLLWRVGVLGFGWSSHGALLSAHLLQGTMASAATRSWRKASIYGCCYSILSKLLKDKVDFKWKCDTLHCNTFTYLLISPHRKKKKKTSEPVSALQLNVTFGTCLRTLIIRKQQKYYGSHNKHRWNVISIVQVVAIVSCLFVVVSTLCLIFSTLPSFQQRDGSGKISRERIV